MNSAHVSGQLGAGSCMLKPDPGATQAQLISNSNLLQIVLDAPSVSVTSPLAPPPWQAPPFDSVTGATAFSAPGIRIQSAPPSDFIPSAPYPQHEDS